MNAFHKLAKTSRNIERRQRTIAFEESQEKPDQMRIVRAGRAIQYQTEKLALLLAR